VRSAPTFAYSATLWDVGWAEDNPGAATLPATSDKKVLRLNMGAPPDVIAQIPGLFGMILRLTEALLQRDSISRV
jgi:hypothetical protein